MPVVNERVRPEQPPRLRLPGFRGYAFYVRPTWLQSMEGEGTLERAVDLELLTPDFRLEVFARPCLNNFAKDLAQWFFCVAWETEPDFTVADFHDPEAGLSIGVEDSDGLTASLRCTITVDPDRWGKDQHSETFCCARASLLQAATDIDLAFDTRWEETA